MAHTLPNRPCSSTNQASRPRGSGPRSSGSVKRPQAPAPPQGRWPGGSVVSTGRSPPRSAQSMAQVASQLSRQQLSSWPQTAASQGQSGQPGWPPSGSQPCQPPGTPGTQPTAESAQAEVRFASQLSVQHWGN